jgi:hypothetical protein
VSISIFLGLLIENYQPPLESTRPKKERTFVSLNFSQTTSQQRKLSSFFAHISKERKKGSKKNAQ